MRHPVTPEDADKLAEYVTKWQTRLGRADWRIVRSAKRPKGVCAEVAKMDLEQRLATYRVGMDFGAEPVTAESLEDTAVHELFHILLHELIETAKRQDATTDQIRSAEHRIINTLTPLLLKVPQ
jgi:hypothetical protein